jgi:FMNH2-dependent dimethyl sulfone monooxygenase
MTRDLADTNDDTFLLGIFCLNVSGGITMSKAKDNSLSWTENVEVAKEADAAGWDFLLPLGRWRGVGGETNPNAEQFEGFTWAAAIGALTQQITVFTTCHVPLFHPIMAAKHATTIAQITGGRFGLNIVAGWNESEFAMFGIEQQGHDDRYAVAHEWLTVVERLCTDDGELDLDGDYFRIRNAYVAPQPPDRKRPPIIAAGQSKAGLDFALSRADFNFQAGPDVDVLGGLAKSAQERARELDSSTRLLTFGPIIVKDTEAEARRYYEWYVNENGDFGAAAALIEGLLRGGGQGLPDDVRARMHRSYVAGWGGVPLMGTPEQVVNQMLDLRAHGYAGYAGGWLDYREGLGEFNEKVLPLMVEAGLRPPLAHSGPAASGAASSTVGRTGPR